MRADTGTAVSQPSSSLQGNNSVYCLYTVCTLSVHFLYTVFTLSVYCLYTACTLLVHCLYTARTLSVYYLYTAWTLFVHCPYTFCILSVHCLYTVCTLSIRCPYIVCILSIHCIYTVCTSSGHFPYTVEVSKTNIAMVRKVRPLWQNLQISKTKMIQTKGAKKKPFKSKEGCWEPYSKYNE